MRRCATWKMISTREAAARHARALREVVPESLMQDGFINLPIQPVHRFVLAELPMHHRDPSLASVSRGGAGKGHCAALVSKGNFAS